jgi:hypothetical protein
LIRLLPFFAMYRVQSLYFLIQLIAVTTDVIQIGRIELYRIVGARRHTSTFDANRRTSIW